MSKKRIFWLIFILGAAIVALIAIQIRFWLDAIELERSKFDYVVAKSINEVVYDIENIYTRKAVRINIGRDSVRSKNEKRRDFFRFTVEMSKNWEEKIPNTVWYHNKDNNIYESLKKYRKDVNIVSVYTDENISASFSIPLPYSLKEQLEGIDIRGLISKKFSENGLDMKFEYAVKEHGVFVVMSDDFFNKDWERTYTRNMYLDDYSNIATLFIVFPDQVFKRYLSPGLMIAGILCVVLLLLCFIYCIRLIIYRKRLSSARQNFVNTMAHEFKAPLSTIVLATQMLKEGKAKNNFTCDTEGLANIIGEESKRLEFMLESLLDMSRMTSNRLELKMEPVGIHRIIEDILPSFRLELEEKQGSLNIALNAEADEIIGNEMHISGALLNILRNAVKYCDKKPEISLSTDNNHKEIIISITDNGIGIAEKDYGMIFEEFYRVPIENGPKGFGLGLVYVKKVVEAHKGRILIKSSMGEGSRFDLIFPLKIG